VYWPLGRWGPCREAGRGGALPGPGGSAGRRSPGLPGVWSGTGPGARLRPPQLRRHRPRSARSASLSRPSAVIIGTPVCGTGGTPADPYGSPGPGRAIPAQAAGMTAADASTAPVSAARTVASRPRRSPSLDAIRRRGSRPGRVREHDRLLAAQCGPLVPARTSRLARQDMDGAEAGVRLFRCRDGRGSTTRRCGRRDWQQAGRARPGLR